jgi:ATP-dependent DNA helicase RecQ
VRILVNAGALTISPPENSRVRVRLTATTQRIASELAVEASMEIGLLRALWRSVGKELHLGADVDLNGLPPGLNGAALCTPLLDSLQARQFIHWQRRGGGIRLSKPAASLKAFDIDWAALEQRRKGEISKLDTMQRYAYTRQCRRAFFLRYFGETPRARRCTSCDNCR